MPFTTRDRVLIAPPREEANLVLLDPFYKSSFFFDARVIRGVRVVSDLQIYVDLMCFPRRGREQAQVILKRRLGPPGPEDESPRLCRPEGIQGIGYDDA